MKTTTFLTKHRIIIIILIAVFSVIPITYFQTNVVNCLELTNRNRIFNCIIAYIMCLIFISPATIWVQTLWDKKKYIYANLIILAFSISLFITGYVANLYVESEKRIIYLPAEDTSSAFWKLRKAHELITAPKKYIDETDNSKKGK